MIPPCSKLPQPMLADLLATLTGVAAFASFSWALTGHFSSQSMGFGMRAISLLSLLSIAGLLLMTWSAEQPLVSQVLGAIMHLLSGALFWWAVASSRGASLKLAFDPKAPGRVLVAGAYKFIRHPFYSSYLVYWSGWAISCWTPFAALPLVLLTPIYLYAAQKEERSFLLSELCDPYIDYRRGTGAFFPRLWRSAK